MGPSPQGSGTPEPTVGQISCSMASTLVRYARSRAGDEGVESLLASAGVPYTVAFLDDPSNWIWQSEAIDLLSAAAVLFDDEQIGLRVGEQTVRQHAGTPVA